MLGRIDSPSLFAALFLHACVNQRKEDYRRVLTLLLFLTSNFAANPMVAPAPLYAVLHFFFFFNDPNNRQPLYICIIPKYKRIVPPQHTHDSTPINYRRRFARNRFVHPAINTRIARPSKAEHVPLYTILILLSKACINLVVKSLQSSLIILPSLC